MCAASPPNLRVGGPPATITHCLVLNYAHRKWRAYKEGLMMWDRTKENRLGFKLGAKDNILAVSIWP